MNKIIVIGLLLTLQACNGTTQMSSDNIAKDNKAVSEVVELEGKKIKSEQAKLEKAKPKQASPKKVIAPMELTEKLNDSMQLQGKVVYLTMEGGFFGVVTKDGRKLLPMNLPKQFQQDGAVIQFSGKVLTDIVTIQQWGTPFKFQDVELIEAGNGNGRDK